MMEQSTTILNGYSDQEKGAYLSAIASIATADHAASEEEMEYLDALAEAADVSEEQKELIHQAAAETSGEDLNRSLDILKQSELRFSLVSDLIAFAESDQNYSEEEKHNVEQIAAYLGVNQEQFSVLNQFTKKAVQEMPAQAEELEAQNTTPANFLDGLGFGDKMKSAGINTNALLKGAIGILGPILLARMFRGRGGRSMGGGLLGGAGGGLLGGLLGGGLLGGLLGGGRGNSGGFAGAGELLGKILGGRR